MRKPRNTLECLNMSWVHVKIDLSASTEKPNSSKQVRVVVTLCLHSRKELFASTVQPTYTTESNPFSLK